MSVGDLQEKWTSVGCAKSKLDELRAYACCVDHLWLLYSLGMLLLCRIGNFGAEIEWQKFLSLACTALEKVQCIYVYSVSVLK